MRDQPADLTAFCYDLAEWFSRGVPSTGLQTVERTELTLGTSIGVRDENQDRVAVARFSAEDTDQSFLILALVDGMGGDASRAECAPALLWLTWSSALLRVRHRKCRIVFAQPPGRLMTRCIASTMAMGGGVCACIALDTKGQAVGMHIGDSRIYEYLPHQGRLNPVTLDHNIANHVNQLVSTGLIEAQEPTYFSRQITQFIGQGEGLEPTFHDLLSPGEERHYLITSDGAHRLPLDTFTKLISCAQSSHQAVHRVLAVAKWCGGEDNASAICVRSLSDLLTSEIATRPGYLEVWDSFGKISLCLPLSGSRDPMQGRAEPKKELELQFTSPNSRSIGNNAKGPKKARGASRRTQRDKAKLQVSQKPSPEIELINNE